MATRLKTVEYCMPTLASVANNTLTNFSQITIYLPETGKTFRRVKADLRFDDIITGTGGTLTTKTREFRLGAAAYTTESNANALTNSGENLSGHVSANMTSHFQTNFGADTPSQTFDFRITFNQSTGTTLGLVNVTVIITITYEYDDTSATHIKTVWIPLNAPVANITTSAVTYDTFPALDTYLPEASKTYRRIFVVVTGNEHRTGAVTTDHTMTINVGATTVTTGNYEGALGSDRAYRYVFDLTAAGFTGTNTTHNFQLSATVARCHHPQAWVVVTYEFDPVATSTVMNSVLLPAERGGPAGGTTSADYQRMTTVLRVLEPATVTLQRLACFLHWDQQGAVAGLNARLGTGSFVAYTDVADTLCGGNAAMVRNDAPTGLTLARGDNTLICDVYRTDSVDFASALNGYFMVNYTSGKSTAGVGAHLHTVKWTLATTGTAAAGQLTQATEQFLIPEASYEITCLGIAIDSQTSGTATDGGAVALVERLAAEGGVEWVDVANWVVTTDAEVGVRRYFDTIAYLFRRWADDPDPARLDIEVLRRYRVIHGNGASTWDTVDLWVSYHALTWIASGTVSGYADPDGAGLTVWIVRKKGAYLEHVGTATTTAGGAYTFTWIDNVDQLAALCAEDATHTGMSWLGVAS